MSSDNSQSLTDKGNEASKKERKMKIKYKKKENDATVLAIDKDIKEYYIINSS